MGKLLLTRVVGAVATTETMPWYPAASRTGVLRWTCRMAGTRRPGTMIWGSAVSGAASRVSAQVPTPWPDGPPASRVPLRAILRLLPAPACALSDRSHAHGVGSTLVDDTPATGRRRQVLVHTHPDFCQILPTAYNGEAVTRKLGVGC